MSKRKKIVILGASGLIGRYLYNHIKNNGLEVIGTYHRNKSSDSLLSFDITEDDVSKLCLDGTDYAVICSAVTKIDECRNENASEINIQGIEKVILSLSKKSITPVFISGAVVFNGQGNEKEQDNPCPINEYGRQKVHIENFLADNSKDYLIIRPGKIFGVKPGEGIFSEWIRKLKSNEEIRCARDEILSLTYAEDIARAILALMEKKKRGIFHINNKEHKSRFEFARGFFDYLHLNPRLVECSLEDFNFSEKRGKNLYIDSSKFEQEIGFRYTQIRSCYDLIRKNHPDL